MAGQQTELHSLPGAGCQGRWLQMCSLVMEMLGYLDGWRRSQKRTASPPYMLVIPQQAQSLCLCGYHAGELFWWRKTGEEEKGRGCEELLGSASQSSFSTSVLKYFEKSQAASAAEMLIKALERPRWKLCSSPGCHGPRLSYLFCTSCFHLLVGDILRVLQGRKDGESVNS